VDWNNDQLPDLLLGKANGTIEIYLNIGSAEEPNLALAQPIMFGPAGGQIPFDVGNRATPDLVDWDRDGQQDLLCGALDGRFRILINAGTAVAPFYEEMLFAQNSNGDLTISANRSSPVLYDFNGDGLLDLISGNTSGQIMLSLGIGTVSDPLFGDWQPVSAGGMNIDLNGTLRSRPSLCDWNGDSIPDLLIGYGDGLVRQYNGLPAPVEDLHVARVGALITLSWSESPAAGYFRIYGSGDAFSDWQILAETTDFNYQLELTPELERAFFRVTQIVD
jgi:hypothetical protein